MKKHKIEPETINLSVGDNNKRKARNVDINEILSIYKRINGNAILKEATATEKIALIGYDALEEFCLHPYEYLLPTQDDINQCGYPFYISLPISSHYEITGSIEEMNPEMKREYNMVIRAVRDSQFRKKVVGKYGMCAICGCKEPRLLEAAHIIAVKNGGSDEISNGICLCCNHHKMFDSDLLIFTDKKMTRFEICSEYAKEQPEYRLFTERNFSTFYSVEK